MKICDYHEIVLCVIEMRENGIPGDVYTSFTEFKADHPTSGYRFGVCIVDSHTGIIPLGYDDWYPNVESALLAHREVCHAA